MMVVMSFLAHPDQTLPPFPSLAPKVRRLPARPLPNHTSSDHHHLISLQPNLQPLIQYMHFLSSPSIELHLRPRVSRFPAAWPHLDGWRFPKSHACIYTIGSRDIMTPQTRLATECGTGRGRQHEPRTKATCLQWRISPDNLRQHFFFFSYRTRTLSPRTSLTGPRSDITP